MSGQQDSGDTTRRVFFHVGAPKTGTTYLQDLLFRHRHALEAAGVLYPARRRGDHFRAMLDLRDIPWGGGYRDPAVPGSWDRLAARVRSWPGTVVISQEILAGATT